MLRRAIEGLDRLNPRARIVYAALTDTWWSVSQLIASIGAAPEFRNPSGGPLPLLSIRRAVNRAIQQLLRFGLVEDQNPRPLSDRGLPVRYVRRAQAKG